MLEIMARSCMRVGEVLEFNPELNYLVAKVAF
jgi:hypothetical protein